MRALERFLDTCFVWSMWVLIGWAVGSVLVALVELLHA